ncbi:hypothetical protein AJ87_19015 [Rhizobium yanglingense]|nr:hypothetical protein AJ87_19015 [Rhizobium yanglingense]
MQLGHRRRQHEDGYDICRHLLLQLLGALPIDVEKHVAAFGHRCFHRFARRAVEIAVHFSPFQQRIGIAQSLEFADALEVVVNALDLTRAPLAGRHAD